MQVVSPPVLLTKLCSQIDMPTWLICDRTPNETGKPAVTGDMRELPTRLRGALHCFDEAQRHTRHATKLIPGCLPSVPLQTCVSAASFTCL